MSALNKKPRPWRCFSKTGDIHIWERITETGQKLRQFRFGAHRECQIITSVINERDIVEDVYEGGFTVWHGTLHALSYFSGLSEKERAPLMGKRAVEIGCGNGVLGIYSLLYLNAYEVYFQDLNYNVLQWCTQRNLELNNIKPSKASIKLLSGTWDTVFDVIPTHTFSLIMTSDTVYRDKNFEDLHRLFDYLLDFDSESRVFVSGKNMYFGNDGGVLAFAAYVGEKGAFTAKVVYTDDRSVPHSLIRLQRVSTNTPGPSGR